MLNSIFHFMSYLGKPFLSGRFGTSKNAATRKNFAMFFARNHWRKDTIRLCSSLYRWILAAMARNHGGKIS